MTVKATTVNHTGTNTRTTTLHVVNMTTITFLRKQTAAPVTVVICALAMTVEKQTLTATPAKLIIITQTIATINPTMTTSQRHYYAVHVVAAQPLKVTQLLKNTFQTQQTAKTQMI